jgi:hypothetical protein
MTTLILSKNVVRAALFFHVHALRRSGYWSAVWSPKISRFMMMVGRIYRNYSKAKWMCKRIPVKARRGHRKVRVTVIRRVSFSSEGTELGTKVLVFVLVAEASVEKQVTGCR